MRSGVFDPAPRNRRVSNWQAKTRVKLPGLVDLLAVLAWFMFAAWPATVAHAGQVLPNSYAWGENVGWLNALPLGTSGPGLNVGDNAVTGYMWGENVGWISFSCTNDSSCGSVNYGVARNATGGLSGYAWGENIGWVSLSCQNTGSCGSANYGVTVDPFTGAFFGFAWGENVGWISFSCTSTATCNSVPFGVQELVVAHQIPTLTTGGIVALVLALLALFRFSRRKLAA
jgi:hypothetical protein